MNIYQVQYYCDEVGEYIGVKGLPLYKTKEQAETIAKFMESHPENRLSFTVVELYLMESE